MSDFDNALDIEESFFAGDKKESRKERKYLQQKDRSKYKKTDQKENLSRYDDLPVGRVIEIIADGAVVSFEGTTLPCVLRGALKKEYTNQKNLLTIGDFVSFEQVSPNQGAICFVHPRKSVLSRADNLSRRKEQLIAANIDIVVIVVSLHSPILKPSLVDRYLIATRSGNMDPIIVVNKVDLLAECSEEEQSLFTDFLEGYSSLGFPVIRCSTKTGEGISSLQECMKGKTSVFSGQSGVGKSSLINACIGTCLLTGEVVEKTRKGSHTTTKATLIPLEGGGFCVDTPGIKSFGLWNPPREDLQSFFSEIADHALHCKFPRCTHVHEPSCAVIEAVNEGAISYLRYASYISLLEEAPVEQWE